MSDGDLKGRKVDGFRAAFSRGASSNGEAAARAYAQAATSVARADRETNEAGRLGGQITALGGLPLSMTEHAAQAATPIEGNP
jgi:hypothetical protein